AGTFGDSYTAGAQILLAAEKPPGLAAVFSQVAATDQFKNGWVYMDGGVRLHIRVEVTSSNFPLADRNPNAFVDLSKATEKDFVVASQTIYHDADHPSHVELPIIPRARVREWIEAPFPGLARRTD